MVGWSSLRILRNLQNKNNGKEGIGRGPLTKSSSFNKQRYDVSC